MENLRPANARPHVLVDNAAFGVADPARVFVGRPRPLGRERVLYALPLDPGPALLRPPTVIRNAAFLADPSPALVGHEAIWVSRMLVATPTEDTRQISP